MVKGAKSLEFHEEDAAIPFQQPFSRSPSSSYNVARSHSTPLFHTTSYNADDHQDNEEASPDGAISTLVNQACNRNNFNRNSPRSQVGESPPFWLFICALLLILALLTLIAKELTNQLGPDHWAIAVLNSTTEPIKNILI